MKTSGKRWLLIIGGVVLVFAIGGFFAFKYGLRVLKEEVQSALGPNSEVKEINVGLTGVEIVGIRIRASSESGKSPAWPVEDELRADRVWIVPSVTDLFSAKIKLHAIEIENAYVSVLRSGNGKVRLLPSLLEKTEENPGKHAADKTLTKQANQSINIEKIILKNGSVDFIDTSLGKKTVKVQLEKIDIALGRIELPDLTGQTSVDVKGTVKGNQRDGTLSIKGAVELGTYELGLTSSLRDVDLTVFQPYLLKGTESNIKSGTLNLDLNSAVRNGVLHAPGTVTLQNLELEAKTQGGMLMGISQNALLSLMKSKSGKITVHFTLEGNINDPKFSLNENLVSKFSLALADSLGVSVEGLTKGVGGAGNNVVKGLSQILKKINR